MGPGISLLTQMNTNIHFLIFSHQNSQITSLVEFHLSIFASFPFLRRCSTWGVYVRPKGESKASAIGIQILTTSLLGRRLKDFCVPGILNVQDPSLQNPAWISFQGPVPPSHTTLFGVLWQPPFFSMCSKMTLGSSILCFH